MPRKITLKTNEHIHPCPLCGNTTVFVIHSEQVQEDLCEIWPVCVCGYDPTAEDSNNRMEDVWGSTDDDNCINAINLVWQDIVKVKEQNDIKEG